MPYPTDLLGLLGIWTGFFLTIAIYSYQLYKENVLYRLAEHIYVGIAFAIVAVTTWETTQKTAVVPLLNGDYIYLIPLALGVMMYTIFTSKIRWMSRYSVAVLVGTSIGVRTVSLIIPSIISQVITTISAPKQTALDIFNYLFIGVGTVCALLYFILTHEHKGVLKGTAQFGRYVMMIGLGTMFGNTILMRMAMLSGRVEYLLQVLKIIPM